MEETVVSTVCKTQKPEECLANEEFKVSNVNNIKNSYSFDKTVDRKNYCIENCGNEKEKINLANEKTGINENSGCLTPSGPFEGCEPPLGEWAGLRKLTGTRPTVGNFTISRYNPQESQKIHEKCLNDSKYRVREAKNQDFKTKLRESQIFSQTDKTQLDNNILLRTRAAAIFHWKTELNFVSQEVESEISKIQGELRRLWSCSQAVDIIRNIGKDIQRIRKPTEQPDLMKDALAEEITKEVKLSNDVLNLYIRCIDETKMQLVELKSAKQRLEHDWSDKSVAYDVDTTCIGLKNNSEILQWKPGSVQVPPDQSTPDGHTSFVKQSIIYAKTAISRSELLRANMKENTTKCLNDLRKQAAAVEIALTDQIVHLTATIKSLETALKECLKRLSDNEILINTTNSAIRGLDGPMKCAQTRLGMRLTRENIENCRDATQKGLIDEAKNIAEGTTALSGQLEAVQDSTKSLIDLRKKLENDLLVKNKKLWIDRERCRVMRSYYPSIHALSGY